MEFKFNAVVSAVMLVAVIFAIAADCASVENPIIDNYQGVPVYKSSLECSMLGGICVQEGDCADGELTQKRGLCPNHEMGVECCYGVVPREGSCKHFGGECMDTCGVSVRQPLGIDCTGDQICCILVN